jgi:hypothetical protein
MPQLPEASLPATGPTQELAQAPDRSLGVARVNLQLMAQELRSEAVRIAGLDGLAQADALLDIAADPDFPNSVWPLDEMISLLQAGDDTSGRRRPCRRRTEDPQALLP